MKKILIPLIILVIINNAFMDWRQAAAKPIDDLTILIDLSGKLMSGNRTLTLKNVQPLREVQSQADSSAYLFLRLSADDDSGFSVVLAQWELINEHLRSLKLSTVWNVMLQGESEIQSGDIAEQIEREVIDLWDAKKVDSYHDEQSVIISFYSSKLSNSINTGTQPINLQVAAHLDSASGLWRITIVNPVMTGEL